MGGKDWRLTAPLIYEGRTEFFIVHEGFHTDFASVPRFLRWLFDNAGRNAEAAVLHDVLWNASKNGDDRLDAWNVDALFRRALRQTGATPLTRGVMWAAVRFYAITQGRLGSPTHITPLMRAASLTSMAVVGVLTAAPAAIVVAIATTIFWALSWIVAIAWRIVYERTNFPPNEQFLPWPLHRPGQIQPPLSGATHRHQANHATDSLEIIQQSEGAWLRDFPISPVESVTTERLDTARPEPSGQ